MEIENIKLPVEQTTEEIISNLESCALCGSKLRFKHQTDYLKLQVLEEAMCPECGIKNKVASHILQ